MQGDGEDQMTMRENYAYTSGFLKESRPKNRGTSKTMLFDRDSSRMLEEMEKSFNKIPSEDESEIFGRGKYVFHKFPIDDKKTWNSTQTLKNAIKVYGYNRSKSSMKKRSVITYNTKAGDSTSYTQRSTLPDPFEKSYGKGFSSRCNLLFI